MKKRMIIGLTGPIASGKDLVARLFARKGALVMDADKVGHRVIEPQTKAWHEIIKVFGSRVLSRGGHINRKKLAKVVFSDRRAMSKLNMITHPEIKRTIKEMIARSNRKLIVINAALLAEIKLLPLVDKVVAVLADEKVRLKRAMRAGRSRADAMARIRSQAKASSYRRIADIIIINNGSKKELNGQFQDRIRL